MQTQLHSLSRQCSRCPRSPYDGGGVSADGETDCRRVYGQTSQFDFQKVDRSKLYGKRQRVALDPNGQPCHRGELMADGSTLLRRGMSAQGYFGRGRHMDPNWAARRAR